MGANRFGCSAARNKRSSVCSNWVTISQTDIEARVLRGLQHHLMDRGLVRLFREEYAAELPRMRENARAARAAKQAELAKVVRDTPSSYRLIPEGNDFAVDLTGELAGLLALGASRNDKTRAQGAGSVDRTTMVAGAGFGHWLQLGRAHHL